MTRISCLALGLISGILSSLCLYGQTPVCKEVGFGEVEQISVPQASSNHAVTAGDFDGDGLDDVAASNVGSGAPILVMWNGPTRTVSSTVSGSPIIYGDGGPIVAADINNDGFDDLVVHAENRYCIPLISLGPQRAFERRPEVNCQVDLLYHEDLNLDGYEDILGYPLSGPSIGISDVTVLLGGPTGELTRLPGFLARSPFGSFAHSAVGDVTGDGIPDLVFAGPGAQYQAFPNALNRSLIVTHGTGTGDFEIRDGGRGVWIGGWPWALAVRDLDEDALADAVVLFEDRLEVYLAAPGGEFRSEPASSEPVPFRGGSLTLDDFNGDGNVDVIVNPRLDFREPRQYFVLRGDGRGGFEADHLMTSSDRFRGTNWPVVAGDFDSDGRRDLATIDVIPQVADRSRMEFVLLPNSCPVRISLESEQPAIAPGEAVGFRGSVRNIAVAETLTSVSATPTLDPGHTLRSEQLDNGSPCSGGTCVFGVLAPGQERSFEFEVSREPDAALPVRLDLEQSATFGWIGGSASTRAFSRFRIGPDVEISVETLGDPVPGGEMRFRVRATNIGTETVDAAFLGANDSLQDVRFSDCACSLGPIEVGAEVARELTLPIPIDAEDPVLAVSFNVSIGSQRDAYIDDNGVALVLDIEREPDPNAPLVFRDLETWSVDPGVRVEMWGGGLREYDSGRIHRTIDGLTPGQVYSLRVLAGADREAQARTRIRASAATGSLLAEAGPFEASTGEVLQTLLTAPADGVILVELFGEIAREAIVRGEIAGITWVSVELRPAAPKMLRVPEDFGRIQDALDASSDGDTISVGSGLYRGNLDLGDRAIILESREGPDRTIVDAGRNGDVVTVDATAPRTTAVRGFTLRNGGYGARIAGSATLEYCTISDNSKGVEAKGRTVVRYNRIRFNGRAVEAAGEVEITDNLISNSVEDRSRFIDVTGTGYLFARNRIGLHQDGYVPALLARGARPAVRLRHARLLAGRTRRRRALEREERGLSDVEADRALAVQACAVGGPC